MAERESVSAHARPEEPTQGSIRVLLVDEEPLVRKGLRCFLKEEWGAAVDAVEAPTLAAATPLAGDLNPMLIVLGARHGDTAVSVRALLEQASRARVIVLSDEDDAEDARQAFASGAHAFVLRERALAELRVAVDDVLAGSQYLDPAVGASLVVEPPSGSPELTARELLVLELVADGLTNREIARRLDLSTRTVEGSRATAQRKLGLRTRAAVVQHVRGARPHGVSGGPAPRTA